jgi:pimeloyl-ACP methyl ester carboxylesterase
MPMFWRIVTGVLGLILSAQVSSAQVARPRPVGAVGDAMAIVQDKSGTGMLPLYASEDWTRPHPEITRVVLVFHGLNRNADAYFAAARTALAAAGEAGAHTMMVAPQFLAEEDIEAHKLSPQMLRWRWNEWASGENARGPIPVSSFAALDAILARLADPAMYPNLAHVVIAGHSAGGQVVQRYAVVGNGAVALAARGVAVRYVLANPGSYLYFGEARPAATCAGFDQWRYGLAGHVPPYVTLTPAELEARYIARDVVYLLGTADTDPAHPQLDRSCAAEAQGPYRHARGVNYLRLLRARDGDAVKHRLLEVPGVAHNGGRMFTSACGLAALFDTPGC